MYRVPPLLRPPTIHSWTATVAAACDPSVVGQTNLDLISAKFTWLRLRLSRRRGSRALAEAAAAGAPASHILTHLFSLLAALHPRL